MTPDQLMPLISWLPLRYTHILLIVMGVCAFVSAIWKPPAPTSPWYLLYRIVNLLGQNYCWARNTSNPMVVPQEPTSTETAVSSGSVSMPQPRRDTV